MKGLYLWSGASSCSPNGYRDQLPDYLPKHPNGGWLPRLGTNLNWFFPIWLHRPRSLWSAEPFPNQPLLSLQWILPPTSSDISMKMENSPEASNIKQIEKQNYAKIPTKIYVFKLNFWSISTFTDSWSLSVAIIPYLWSLITEDSGHAHFGVLSHL